ncbi:hypothetical protein Q31b_57300 [Novipirellula aureliae]|uniref:Uncharacterized protein n=1 Tax=Novipirellula aureliae TaxID=2527966 RepID=A0A5C6D951_9BACT|nr:hypothetical protein [Novipirellula aureliae]TWU33673.1 hypothetical protein Q31b_57300 [Novipirellula aureliae]
MFADDRSPATGGCPAEDDTKRGTSGVVRSRVGAASMEGRRSEEPATNGVRTGGPPRRPGVVSEADV